MFECNILLKVYTFAYGSYNYAIKVTKVYLIPTDIHYLLSLHIIKDVLLMAFFFYNNEIKGHDAWLRNVNLPIISYISSYLLRNKNGKNHNFCKTIEIIISFLLDIFVFH